MDRTSGMKLLEQMTEAAIDAARVKPGEQVGKHPANTTGKVLIRPGGRACYPAVWTQDFYMTLETGFVSLEEATNHLLLIAAGQNGPDARVMRTGAVVPAFAVPDHMTFDGKPVYFPGTYSSGDDQGGEPWGMRPPVNNYYDFIAIAHYVCRKAKDASLLRREVGGITLIERLRRAYEAPEHEAISGLVKIAPERRAVGFIFCDSIYMTGRHLMASMLRIRAARHLADLEKMLNPAAYVRHFHDEAEKIADSLSWFREHVRIGGWLFAASGIGRQPDVWGTIYALAHGLLLSDDHYDALEEVVAAINAGTIVYRGAVRHVPTDYDASATSAWERTPTEHNRYQNGAYWHTPTGWLIKALLPKYPALAEKIFIDMMTALEEQDFRKGESFGAPWECFGPEAAASNNPVFLATVTVPYSVLREIW